MPVEENSVIEDFERVIHGYFNEVSKKQRRSGYSKEEIEKYKATTKEPDQDFIKYFSKFYA